MSLIGTGLYSLDQAARLVRADARAVRRWMLGYSRTVNGEKRTSLPLWTTQLRGEDLQGNFIGFQDLVELRFVNAFARHGVSLPVIRATADFARQQFGTNYPLTSQRFLTDGKTIFYEAVRQSGESDLLEVRQKQFVFADIIKPSLFAGLEYADGVARRWYPMGTKSDVVLDPDRQFGTPVVASVGIPTDTIYASYLAECKRKSTVARIFDLTIKAVSDAVKFEEGLLS
jgi:uncharacterized protein (DUF433 family)